MHLYRLVSRAVDHAALGSQPWNGGRGEERSMARLAIAKDFLAEYAKLEKNVQSAVESAIAKFAEHTHAGLHLEKLHHDRIRTIRVDSFWRGVVLAPDTGDTYCLITVLPHDKADAYATSHRFTVNQALGMLEVRNEEAIQQLQPALTAVARPGEKRPFADVSDSDLTQLGVDAQILRLWAIVDEAALHRPVGGTAVMRSQLGQLTEASHQPHITLQVIPYDVGGHPGMSGSFVVLQFADAPASDVVYIETQAGDLFLESDTDVERFGAIFEHLRALALLPEASQALITSVARDL